jgi:hypothetical protein
MLFDGSGLSHWRGFQRSDVPSAWSVKDGAITLDPTKADATDLVTREEYGDFDLELEWKIAPGGNSGIIYRSTEDEQYPWLTGPEMQVLDNEKAEDNKLPSHLAGALYDLVPVSASVAHPAGQWNRARIRVQGDHIQQWLNGMKTADVVIGSPEWKQLLAKSKFIEMPAFATRPRGHIVLQNHGAVVSFRNVRVKRLDSAE